MILKMKSRTFVRILSYILAIIIALTGAVISRNYKLSVLKRDVIHNYQAALENLDSSLENLSITLEKSLYIGTASGLSTLTNQLILLSGNAGASLSSLPGNEEGVRTISKFLSQVGDYSAVLSKKAINGLEITEDERNSLISLSDTAKKLSLKVDDIKTMYNSYEKWSDNVNSTISGAAVSSGVSASINEVEESISDYPSLIYDGPFSDHINQRESELLKSSKPITEEQAATKAASIIKTELNNLKRCDDESGTMPSYCYSSGGSRVAITKNGGYVSYYTNDRKIDKVNLSYERAVKVAAEYVESMGLGNFASSYYFADEGVCTINFAYKQGKVTCYTDLIKIGVALDNGQVVTIESRGYIMNHKSRTLKTEKITLSEAESVLSPYLTVKSYDYCVIPSGGANELYCYEYRCTGQKNEDILVYINTSTGAEEELLVLLKTDGGVLTK